MAKKQTKAQRLAKQRQRYYNKQYENLISDFKKLYNQMGLGAYGGEATPSAEDLLRLRGTKSGLVKPNKKTLQKLRSLQTEEQILRAAAHAAKTPEARATYEKMRREQFPTAYEQKLAGKKRRKKRQQYTQEDFEDWGDYFRDQVNQGKTYDQIQKQMPSDINLVEMAEEIKRVINPMRLTQNRPEFFERIIVNGERVLEFIREILASRSARKLAIGEKGAAEYFKKFGSIEMENLYDEADVRIFSEYLFEKFADYFQSYKDELNLNMFDKKENSDIINDDLINDFEESFDWAGDGPQKPYFPD